ncbi:MAG: RNA polymerase sigma factor [Thermoleophilaceae bacterium]|nr:RNA polymerase sigma factor [Thermoleophilaceae bacterium]
MKRPTESRGYSPRELVSPELIDRCRSGDERAWSELVGATYREVYTLCLRVLRDPDDAAEATQDAFLRAWKGLKGYRGDAQFTTWLYRVAMNAAITKQRSRKRRREREVGAEDDVLIGIAAPGSVESAAGARVELEAVQKALETLPEHYRLALLFRDVYGLSIEEMARELDISETAAKVRVHRARKRLKALMFPGEPGAEQ